MTAGQIEMCRSDVRVMLWHMALYGMGAILEDAGIGVRLSWTTGMQPRARVNASDADAEQVADAILRHAHEHARDSSWVMQDLVVKGAARGLMSPRMTGLSDDEWARLRAGRREVLHGLTGTGACLDLRMLSSLGEPCYWSRNVQGQPLQDDGASRLEMQPRNQGSEFVGTRLRGLARTVSARDASTVLQGLDGSGVRDELGRDGAGSRTATGFTTPGPTDNAVAWCALWGISQLPTSPRISHPAVTTGHLGRGRAEWFYLPVWTAAWPPARLRTILASGQLRTAATAGLPQKWAADDVRILGATQWLQARGVRGIIRFPIERFGSDNAPERRAMLGQKLSMATARLGSGERMK